MEPQINKYIRPEASKEKKENTNKKQAKYSKRLVNQTKTKHISQLGMLVAVALVLSYIEYLIPISLGIPGVKLGLANIAGLMALYLLGPADGLAVTVVRIILVGLTFSNPFSMIYSLAGGLTSMLVMVVGKRTGKFSLIGVSILGGIIHNIAQLGVAMIIVETRSLIYYMPVLLIVGTVTGLLIGIVGAGLVKRLILAGIGR